MSSVTVTRCIESPLVVGTADSSAQDVNRLLQPQRRAFIMASSRTSAAAADDGVRFNIRPTSASVVPARAAVIATPSARIQQPTRRTYLEPAFIETDFTVPIDASTSGRLPCRVHDMKMPPSSSRPSPAAAMSPSSAAVSPALPLRSPDPTAVDRTRPILSPVPAAASSSPSPSRAKILPAPLVLTPRAGADGAQNLVIKDEFARGSTPSLPKYATVVATSHTQQSASAGKGMTPAVSDRAKMIVKSVQQLAGMQHQLTSADRASRQHVIVNPRSVESKLLVQAHRASSANRVASASVTMAPGSMTSSSMNRVMAHGHGQQAAHGRDGIVGSTYDRHRLADVAHQRSFSDLIPKPVRQLQLGGVSPTDDHLRHSRDSASAPLSILSPSSLSGGYVYQQQPHNSSSTSISGSVLRPALMRMAATNPEASRAFRSTVGPSQGSVLGSSTVQTSTSPTASGKIALQRTSASAASDLTSHYRAIQPKPVGIAVCGPPFSSLQPISVDTRAISVSSVYIKSSPSSSMSSRAPDSMSAVIVTRPSHTTSSFVPITGGSRRPVASNALSSPLSIQPSAVLNVPRVPVAAHVSPKTGPLPPSSLPPPPSMHRSPLVSPLPPPSHRSSSDLMPAVATMSRNTSSAAKSSSSISAASCNRSAHQVVSTVPRYSIDTFDQMPLDCSRKNSAAVDVGYVLNLTTSGNQSKADVHQSEVIDLSGSGAVNDVVVSAPNPRHVCGREARSSLSTGNGELEDLTVKKKVVVEDEKPKDVTEQENERLASIVGLKKVTDLPNSAKLAAESFGHATGAVASKTAVIGRPIENGFVAGRSAAREVHGNGSDANAEVKGSIVVEDGNSRNGRSFRDGDTVKDCSSTSTGLCFSTAEF
jgi:hypothetical protein